MAVMAPLAQRLSNHTDLIQSAENRLRSLLQELEI